MYWTMREFCEGFRKLLDHLQLDKVKDDISVIKTCENLETFLNGIMTKMN